MRLEINLISIDEDEKLTINIAYSEDEKVRNNIPTLGGNQEAWFLTENGVYEVLMLSRKSVA